jgi:hypothetical protein
MRSQPPLTNSKPLRTAVRELPIVLLIIAMLLLDAVAVVRVSTGHARELSPISDVLIFSLAYSQAWLLGMWAGLGRTQLLVRLPVVVAALAGWGQLLLILFASFDTAYSWFVLHFTLIAGFVAFVFGGSRMLGGEHLVRIGESADGGSIETASQRFQFTLSEMLQTVAGCGAALSIVKFFYPSIGWFPREDLAVHIAYAGIYATLGVIATWAILHVDFRSWRLGVLGAAAWAFLIAFAIFSKISTIGVWPFLALITGALFVCRASGYRIAARNVARQTKRRAQT